MIRKKKKGPGGAPDWLLTYGDMMTLLFCFFLILVSMSELKEDQRFQAVIESIRRAFGFSGGAGWVPGSVPPNNSFDMMKTQLIMRKWQLQIGKSADEGIEGENPSVRTVREGLEYTFGGVVSFEEGKAQLLEKAKEQLTEFTSFFKGMNTKIRVRGHAATIPRDKYQPFASLDDLSYARAMAVKKFLLEKGITADRVTVEACGDNEPINVQCYDEFSRAQNRRVSVIVTENLIDDFRGQPASDSRTGDLINGERSSGN